VNYGSVTAFALTLQKWADVGQITAGVMSIFVLVTVVLLLLQVRQQAADSRSALITATTSLISEVGRAFIEYPDMRKYFYDGMTPVADDQQRASAIAVILAGAMDRVAAQFTGKSNPWEVAWRSYFTDIIGTSPVLKQHIDAHIAWYGPKLQNYIRSLSA
jgi:hypothetical protein